VFLGGERFEPPGILLGAPAAQHRYRSVDQEPAQIAVAALADRTELNFSAGAVLPRHQAERGGEMPRAGKARPVDKIAAIALDKIGP
jgi:hypothetical protein